MYALAFALVIWYVLVWAWTTFVGPTNPWYEIILVLVCIIGCWLVQRKLTRKRTGT